MPKIRCVSLIVLVALAGCAPRPVKRDIAAFQPCLNAQELTKTGHMDLAVRIATNDPIVTKEVRRAVQFWRDVVDFDWHEVRDNSCSLAVFDAKPGMLLKNEVAIAQSADEDGFEGWIFMLPNLSDKLIPAEIYSTAIHEIGHVFGLEHNRDIHSVMYWLDVDGTEELQPEDLRELAQHHRLRRAAFRAVQIAVQR